MVAERWHQLAAADKTLRMRRHLILYPIIFLMIFIKLSGQEAIHNYGNLQLHKNGSLGFHADFSNFGGFDKNLGVIGFYHPTETLQIGGAFSPTFHDLELGVANNVDLDLSINITQDLNFIYGNLRTEKSRKDISVNFLEKSAYDGISALSKVNGRASVRDQKSFEFPVGVDDMLRPLKIHFVNEVFLAKCSYHMENPDFPKSFANTFDTNKRGPDLGLIFQQEFWDLNTSGRVQITLNWHSLSNLSYYASELSEVTIAGWNRNERIWENLGNTQMEGDLNQGWVQSNIFNANDYEIFTLGFLRTKNSDIPGNYAITPNGDGINDYFTLKIIDKSPNNEFRLFDRTGILVFEQSNYKDEFRGKGNRNIFIGKENLPEGVYFYLLELTDLNLKYQGYFYLVTK